MNEINHAKGLLKLIFGALFIPSITLITTNTTLHAQCPPTANAGNNVTIPCGGSANLGGPPSNPTPNYTLAPTCMHTARWQSNSLTQGGGIYINTVTTTGGTTNINNPNTLVDVGHVDPMGPDAWSTIWLSDYTSQYVEVCVGNTFNLNITAKSLYNNKPYFCKVWVDWNNNGTYENATEVVYTSPAINTHPNIILTNIPITVPAGQPYGAFRMRIRFKDNAPFVASDGGCTYTNPVGIEAPYAGYTSGTGSYTFSDEIEDYSVRVNCGGSSSGTLTYSWSPPDGLSSTTVPDPTATPTQTTTYTVTVTDTQNGCSGTAQVTVTVPSVTPTFNPISPICNGDAAPALPTTSTNGITGTWSPATISNTASGTYTFTPNGGQCATPVTVSVTVNPKPTVTVTNGSYCANGSATLTANGATTYSWSPGTNLSATTGATVTTTTTASTTYTVTGTDNNGCKNTATATVTVNPNPTYTSTQVDPTCGNSDGSVTLTAANGTGPYTYDLNGTAQASGNFTNLPDNTYNITITDSKGCEVTGSVTLTNSTADDPSFTLTNFCQGQANSATGIVTPGGTFSFNPAVSDGATINASTGAITNGVGGTTYTVQYALGGVCPASSTQTVTVNPLPTLTVNTVEYCENGSGTFTVSGATSYTWSPATGLSATTGASVTTNATTNTTYTITGVNANGCTNTTTTTVSVNPNPTFTVATTNPNCGNSDGEIAITTNTGTAPFDFTVNGTTQTSGTFSNLAQGTYPISIEDSKGCTATGSATLTNTSPDDPSFTLTNFCQGQANSATGIVTPGGTFSFNPAVSDGATINATTGEITNGIGGTTYSIQYSLNGVCPTSLVKQVTVNPLPTATATTTDPTCGTNDGAITFTAATGTAPYSYTLGGTTQNNGTFSNLAQGSYTVSITDAKGCSSTATAALTNLPPADPSFDLTDFCEGTSNAASNIATPGGAFSFNPAVSDGATINAATGEITNGVSGTTYMVEYSAPGFCPSTSTQQATVIANPEFTIASVNPTCGNADGSITLSGLTPSTSYSLVYSKNGAPVGPATLTANATGEIVLSSLTVGNYANFSVTISASGCQTIDPTLVQLIEPNAPVISAPNDIVICVGESITLTANNPGNAPISWNNGVIDGQTFAPSGSGIFVVTAVIDNCVSTDQVQVTVNPLPTINAGQDVTICAAASTTLMASGGVSYTWDNGLGAGVSQTVTPKQTTTYQVTGTDINGCVNTDDVTVTVAPIPSLNIDGINLQGCAPVTPTLNNTLADGSVSCKWIFSDGRTIDGCGPINPVFNDYGCYDVTLMVTSAAGCTNTQTIEDYICVYPTPDADFYATPQVIDNYPWEAQMHNYSSNATNYTWYFGDDSAPSNEFEPTHIYSEENAGTFPIMLVASNDVGCVDTAYYSVKVVEPLIIYVPNTFTPDGDRFNNTFFPVITSGFDVYQYEMLIFNRWGELIFETHDTEIGWDGTYDGKMVQDGSYTWKIEIKIKNYDEHKRYVGHVNLVR